MTSSSNAPSSDAQNEVVEAVGETFRSTIQGALQGASLDRALQLWRDFAAEVDVSRTRKPATWAAALLYTVGRLQLSDLTQEETAEWFDVSTITVSKKYRQMAETLDLTLLDARYVPEGQRATVRRRYPSAPEDLPLLDAPTDPWLFSFGTPDFSNESAQDLVYDGWDALATGDLGQARQYFRAALGRDEWLADAYNGLAGIAEAHENWEEAEARYEEAYQRAREALGTESPEAYHWWGELDTRPYMRARQGLGWVYWQTGRYEAAITEYEALLRLNPNDNQGVRYLIGPLYQFAGDLDGALDAYDDYAEQYPDDRGDPHHTYSWGLALYRSGDGQGALHRWYQGFFQNLYVPPLLLGETPPEIDAWHRTNLEYPYYAEEYVARYGELWDRATNALQALRRLWHDPDVEARRDRWLELGQDLDGIAEAARSGDEDARAQWEALTTEQWALEEKPVSEATKSRVLRRN